MLGPTPLTAAFAGSTRTRKKMSVQLGVTCYIVVTSNILCKCAKMPVVPTTSTPSPCCSPPPIITNLAGLVVAQFVCVRTYDYPYPIRPVS